MEKPYFQLLPLHISPVDLRAVIITTIDLKTNFNLKRRWDQHLILDTGITLKNIYFFFVCFV